MREIGIDDVRALLRAACDREGTPTRWARRNGFTPGFVLDVLQGRRDPSDRVCAALDVVRERQVIYRAMDRR